MCFLGYSFRIFFFYNLNHLRIWKKRSKKLHLTRSFTISVLLFFLNSLFFESDVVKSFAPSRWVCAPSFWYDRKLLYYINSIHWEHYSRPWERPPLFLCIAWWLFYCAPQVSYSQLSCFPYPTPDFPPGYLCYKHPPPPPQPPTNQPEGGVWLGEWRGDKHLVYYTESQS